MTSPFIVSLVFCSCIPGFACLFLQFVSRSSLRSFDRPFVRLLIHYFLNISDIHLFVKCPFFHSPLLFHFFAHANDALRSSVCSFDRSYRSLQSRACFPSYPDFDQIFSLTDIANTTLPVFFLCNGLPRKYPWQSQSQRPYKLCFRRSKRF